MNFQQRLNKEFARYGTLTPAQLSQLESHYELLIRWNKKLNLTRITALDEAIQLHYCESLLLGARLPEGPLRIADIGSGPGFPGFPIAVLRPDCHVTLVESHQRKAVFLTEASRDLPNVSIFAGRAEDVTGEFDWIVGRAVTPSDILALPYGHQRGLLVGAADAKTLGGRELLPWGNGRYLLILPRG